MKDINLIPKSYILKKKKEKYRAYLIAAIITFSCVVVLSVIVPNKILGELEKQRDALQYATNSTFVQAAKEQTVLHQFKTEYEEYKKEYEKVKGLGIYYKDYIDFIENAMPKGMTIQSFKLSESGNFEFDFSGFTQSEDDVAAFVDGLRKTKFFSYVDIVMISKSERLVVGEEVKEYKFSIKARKNKEGANIQ